MEADDLRSEEPLADATGERLIADRLDAMEAERVMQRALELEAESLSEPHLITTAQLERIAQEIGVNPAFVQQALGEVRLAPPERNRFDQWVLPDDLIETATISDLTREEVDAAITKWMTQNEGLTQAGQLPDGMEWDIDRRWRAKAISSTLNGGNRISRVAGSDIAHRVHTLSEREHLVAMQSKGRGPLVLAKAVAGLGTLVASLILLGAAVTSDLWNGLLAFVIIAGASTGIGLGGARWWARGIRGALRRSLYGLVNRAGTSRKGWFNRRRKRD